MRPEPTDRSLESAPRGVSDRETNEACDHADFRRDGRNPAADRRGGYRLARKRHRGGKRPRVASSAFNTARRLGPLEYGLLATIALAVAITIAMAILNPSS
jgi:hypothetical protein